jgi:hypothetical protein
VGVNSADAIRFASNGTIYVAPVATAAPTDVGTVLPATWLPLGYVSDAGVSITPTITTQAINAWQSAVPVKYLVTGATFQMAFVLLQFDAEAVELYFGSAFEVNATDEFKMDVASNPDLVETSLIVEWSDSTVTNRLYVPRAQVSAREALTLIRTGATSLGMTLDALDSAGNLGTIFTTADMA